MNNRVFCDCIGRHNITEGSPRVKCHVLQNVCETCFIEISHKRVFDLKEVENLFKNRFNRSRISSLDRAIDCRAGGRGFDSRDWTNTQGFKMTEK